MSNRIYFNLYATPPHKCNYLSNRLATTVFIEPSILKNASLYDSLSQRGFRRSGGDIYRPDCYACNACIAVRLPVQKFVPRRSQRRVWQKNSDLTVSAVPAIFKQEHFNLYRRYLASRHKGDGMDNPSPKNYTDFLICAWAKTKFYEFRLDERLIAVAVIDHFKQGLSAVYTFFDPDYSARSLGVYAILWEIEETKRLNLDWLYLGYWIQDCQKMSYKAEYQPLEYYYQEKWQPEAKRI
ncbi:arginyl-tRNA--protein transferase [Candidatus Thiomargarita nelsonii]|uniref:Aspartate/glutamate leucyltransferase n=1 Tax=Candidatus Thiomargarita nelsonii TaxID=1003181 RepID=A0A0A6PR32_9GAMM|nr:arginyl-tRNA--protein transferase [Candidatus Thiomargarita nelsonii]